MAIDNHSIEAAYATKDNIVVPAYTPLTTILEADQYAMDDLATTNRLNSAPFLQAIGAAVAASAAAKVASDASDVAVQADAGAAAGTKVASTASKAAVDAADVAVIAVNGALITTIDRIVRANA